MCVNVDWYNSVCFIVIYVNKLFFLILKDQILLAILDIRDFWTQGLIFLLFTTKLIYFTMFVLVESTYCVTSSNFTTVKKSGVQLKMNQ